MAKPDYYDVEDCSTHERVRQSSVKSPNRSEGTERSCAYDGARVVLMPVTDAIHLVHGPIACAGNSWGQPGAVHPTHSSTAVVSPPRCWKTM